MAASKPTSQLSQHAHILRYTQRPLWDLSCGSGFFPSRRWTLSLNDCLPGSIQRAFGVWLGLVPRSAARAHPVALPPVNTPRGSTSIDFGENQLSASLISLSLLDTGHPPFFQQRSVRTSIEYYLYFILPISSSLCFRVYSLKLIAHLRLAFATATPLSA